MGRPSRLVLVRHAQSSRNEAKKGSVYFDSDEARKSVRGTPDHDIELTELGHEQARQTGIALRERFEPFDYIYHSGYKRTIDTVEGILSAYTPEERDGIQVRQNFLIRERDSGYAYDMTKEEAKAHFPWFDEYYETFGGFMARPIGGESLADAAARVHQFNDMLFSDRADQNVLVVTHGGTLRCFRFLFEHWDYEQATSWNNEPQPENCGVTTYEFDSSVGRLVLQGYNEVFWAGPDQA